jgi:hypothetical protein
MNGKQDPVYHCPLISDYSRNHHLFFCFHHPLPPALHENAAGKDLCGDHHQGK